MNSLCNDCRNKNCPMQNGIKRTSCEFYKAPTKSGYIRVEDAIKEMQKQYDLLSDSYHAPHRNGIADCIEIMKDISADDVRPADGTDLIDPYDEEVYGLWWRCSKCGYSYLVDNFKYCPQCGRAVKSVEEYKEAAYDWGVDLSKLRGGPGHVDVEIGRGLSKDRTYFIQKYGFDPWGEEKENAKKEN